MGCLEKRELHPLFSALAHKRSLSVHLSQDSGPFCRASGEVEPSLSHRASGIPWLLLATKEAGGVGSSMILLADSPWPVTTRNVCGWISLNCPQKIKATLELGWAQ